MLSPKTTSISFDKPTNSRSAALLSKLKGRPNLSCERRLTEKPRAVIKRSTTSKRCGWRGTMSNNKFDGNVSCEWFCAASKASKINSSSPSRVEAHNKIGRLPQ